MAPVGTGLCDLSHTGLICMCHTLAGSSHSRRRRRARLGARRWEPVPAHPLPGLVAADTGHFPPEPGDGNGDSTDLRELSRGKRARKVARSAPCVSAAWKRWSPSASAWAVGAVLAAFCLGFGSCLFLHVSRGVRRPPGLRGQCLPELPGLSSIPQNDFPFLVLASSKLGLNAHSQRSPRSRQWREPLFRASGPGWCSQSATCVSSAQGRQDCGDVAP